MPLRRRLSRAPRELPHPHPLPADEAAAVRRARERFIAACGSPMRAPETFPIPAADYDLIERAFAHWPDWDPETGQPIVLHTVFCDAEGRMLFKGVPAIRVDA